MASNPFDQFDAPPEVAKPAAKGANPFDVLDAQPEKPARAPATMWDRIDAIPSGFNNGAAYMATLPLDTVANAYNLGKAGIGAASHAMFGTDLPEVSDPSPVGAWLTKQMDKSPITTTQLSRPDDTASRYIATGASVLPAALTARPDQMVRSALTAIPPALAGQAVSEGKPFKSDTANTAASIAVQLGTALAMPRGRGADIPGREEQDAAIRGGQEEGYVTPPSTTNPTAGNRLVESIAGKQKVQQMFSVKNQGVTNSIARDELHIGGSGNTPISEAEIIQAKAAAAPAYDALRGAGPVYADKTFHADIDAALQKQNSAGSLAPSLQDKGVQTVAKELKGNFSFDANEAVDTISTLREKSSMAWRAGDAGLGKAYKGFANAMEGAIDRQLTAEGGASGELIEAYKAARKRFAIIDTIDEARNPTTGNVDAIKLLNAYKKDAPLSGGLLTAAKAAGQSPLAFKEPLNSPGASHVGLVGSLIAGALASEHIPGLQHMGAVPLAAAGAMYGGRSLAQVYARTLGQANAIPSLRTPVSPQMLMSVLASNPELTGGAK